MAAKQHHGVKEGPDFAYGLTTWSVKKLQTTSCGGLPILQLESLSGNYGPSVTQFTQWIETPYYLPIKGEARPYVQGD